MSTHLAMLKCGTLCDRWIMYKLLIVDDEPIIRRGIKSLTKLQEMGISQIFEAQTGVEALENVEKNLPDIVIMDINMPDMDGLSASAMIKETYPEIFIIILTGYDYFEYAQMAIRAKVDDYILKPVSKIDIESLLFKITGILGERNKNRKIEEISKEANEEYHSIAGEEIKDLNAMISEYMKEHIFDAGLSLSKMANDLACNSSYLSVLIKQIYGISFQDYINKKRMERAKLLLLSTSMKNYEIARQVGIEDVNYFVTKFKKMWGLTPKQYREGRTGES